MKRGERFRAILRCGFDDLPIAAYSNPRLTTVTTQAAVQGEQAALAAIDLLEGRRVGRLDFNLSMELIVRDSCGAKGKVKKSGVL